jgi:hypothetical protein
MEINLEFPASIAIGARILMHDYSPKCNDCLSYQFFYLNFITKIIKIL